MTAPVASLFMTPPDMGGQSVAPATGATAGSDSAFGALVSAFFETSEATVPAAQILPQAVLSPVQSPQSADASAAPAADAVNPNSGSADPANLDLPQPGTVSTAQALPESNIGLSKPLTEKNDPLKGYKPAGASDPAAVPKSAGQRIKIAALAQAVSGEGANPARIEITDKIAPQDTPIAHTGPASNAARNEKALTVSTARAEAPADDSNSTVVIAITELGDKAIATDAPLTALPPASLPITAKQEKPAATDEQAEQPTVDILSLSEMASRVIAQLLAAQAQPDSEATTAKNMLEAAPGADGDLRASDVAPPSPLIADPVFQPPAAAPEKSAPAEIPPSNSASGVPAASTGDLTGKPVQTDKQPLPAAIADQPQAMAAETQTSEPRGGRDKQQTAATPLEPTARKAAENSPPTPVRIAVQTQEAPAAAAQIPASGAPSVKPSETMPAETLVSHDSDQPADAPKTDMKLASQPAMTARLDSDRTGAAPPKPAPDPAIPSAQTADAMAGVPQTTTTSTQDDGADSPDAASNAAVTVTRTGIKSAADSPPATSTPVSNPAPAARPAAQAADATSPDDHAGQPVVATPPDVSNPSLQAVEAAAVSISTHPASIAPDAQTAAAEAALPDVQSRPGVAPRSTRSPARAVSGENGDPMEAPNQSAKLQLPDAISEPEKSANVHLAEHTLNRDTSKDASKPDITDSDAAPAPDAPKAHQTVDLAQTADSPQQQSARADAPAAPAAAHNQSAAIDIATPNAVSAHGFEIASSRADTAHGQDVPVKLAFNAPNAPDRSAFDALALKIASHSSGGDSHFSIRLDPAELGKIEVNLSVDAHGHAQAELSADKPQTLELLQKDASALERALKDAGLNLSGGLAFSLKGDGRSQAWRDPQGGRSRSLQIGAADAASANAAITARAALAAHAYGLPTSHLDIRV